MWAQLYEGLKWERLYQECDCERFEIDRCQFYVVIVCYEVTRPKRQFGVIE